MKRSVWKIGILTCIWAGDWFKKKLMDFPNVLSLTGETDWKRGWQTDRETAV